MDNDFPVSIERVFNLGEYKSLRVKINPSELDTEAKIAMMLEEVFDVYMVLYLHQRIGAEIHGHDTSKWDDLLIRLLEMRREYTHDYLKYKEEEDVT